MALITCPECGREISSRAHSCPHCGAANQPRVSAGYDTEIIAPTPAASPIAKVKPPRTPAQRRKRRLAWIGSIIGVVLLAGLGWLLYHDHQLAAEEEASYNQLMDDFSIADAETFLLRYPENKHIKEIKDNIALYQRYEQEWAKIVTSTNVDDFAMFRSKYPDSPFDQKAYDKIDSLDWTYAKRSDTEGALQKYLDLHPDGKYADMAREQKQFIIDSRPTDEERNAIARIINSYFAALTDNSNEALSNITTAAVFSKSCDFIDSHEGNGINSYTVISPVTVEKKPTDSGPTYNASCTVSRTGTDIDGNVTSKTFSVRTSFNTQMQLSAVNMKGQE